MAKYPSRATRHFRLPWLIGLICLVAQLCAMPARAYERDFYFEQINSRQGLAQNGVSIIHQDSQGYIWLATQGGLHRYDGYHLQRFRHDASRADSLPDNLVTGLADAEHGELWVSTRTGDLVRFDPYHDRASAPPPAWARLTDGINTLLGGHGKRLWIGANTGVFVLDPPYHELRQVWASTHAEGNAPVTQLSACGDGRHFAITTNALLALGADATHTQRIDLGGAHALSVLCREDGEVLVGTEHGLLRLADDGARIERMWPVDTTIKDRPVQAMAEDHRHRLWLAVARLGLVRIDSADQPVRVLRPHPRVEGSLPEASINTLFVDRSGLLWAGTVTRGAIYGNPDATPFHYIFDPDIHGDPAAANNIRSLHQNDDGSVWIGFNGSGLSRYDPASDTFRDLTPALEKAFHGRHAGDLVVHAIRREDAGHRMLATNHGLVRIRADGSHAERVPLDLGHDLANPTSTTIFSLLRARDGGWWLGMYDHGLIHYQPGQPLRRYVHNDNDPDSLASNTVIALARDGEGRLWIGTTNGLSMYDPSTDRMRSFHERAGHGDSLSGRVVTNILVGDNGHVWVGTQTGLNRLERLDRDGAHFRRYLMRDGLPDATIYCIGEDRQHNLWLSSNLGIARLDPSTHAIRAFTLRDGLQGMEYNSSVCMRDRAGRLWFGGINGVNVVAPETISTSQYRPATVITGISMGADTTLSPAPRDGIVTMPQSARAIRFTFAAMDFAAPQLNRFQYRLVPFDHAWVDAGQRNSTSYTNLDAGEYRFEVRGSNHEGVFAGTTRLKLIVVPPWWASTAMHWAYAVLGLLAALATLSILRARRAKERSHQAQLRDRERRLSTALWGSGDDFWDVNLREGRLFLLRAQDAADGNLEQALDLDDWTNYMVHPDDLPRLRHALLNHLDGHSGHFEIELRTRSGKTDWTWTLARGRLVERDAHGQPLRLAGTARDITTVRKEERDRRIASEIISNMTEAVTVTDLGFRFVSVNAAFTRMTGYSQDEIAGQDARLLNCPQQNAETYERLRRDTSRHGHWRGELWQRRKDGGEFLSWAEISEVRDASGVRTHYVAVLTDITDRKRAEQELRYLANYDTLTGLPNRTLLGERLSEAILRARRSGRKVAALYIDLDRFKHVNDSMGHNTGDRLLKAAGLRLRQCVREHDTVARVGGDEFTLVVEGASEPFEIEALCRKIINAFVAPLLLDTHQEVLISPSIGVALYPEHGKTPHDLIKHADTAMYQAKERGRNTWMIYTDAMDAAARLRATMAGALRRALAAGELHLVYQPKLALGSERIVGVEALLRWRNEHLGEVSPSTFIPLAEETGLIVEIGEFVLDQACADLRRWRDAGIDELSMAVNLSMAQLQRSDLASRLNATLARHAIPPHCLELELTESTVMGNIEQSMRTLGEFKSIGITVAIDDFGTGYSSLAYLKRLPIDILKIDQTFIKDITIDPDDEAIIATIVTMAHSLGLNVVAEGVENADQVDYLRGHRCDVIQGHWLSVPLDADACIEFCNAHAGRHTNRLDSGIDTSHPV